MKKLIVLIATLFTASLSFAQKNTIAPAAPGVTYGNPVTADKAITLASLNQRLSSDSVYKGKISGKVVEVCTKKGCFMKLSQAGGAQPIMVRFVNYGFFMPQNIVGKTVVVEGEAKSTETTVERLKHYAKDAGKSQVEIAKITASKKDIEIVADGVLVL
jgi:hypothetical protein